MMVGRSASRSSWGEPHRNAHSASESALHAEDHATLAILALQAAGAAESRRLLESERERAVIRAELQEARGHLAERGGQLREVI